jgi:hypothetical protein
VQPAAEAALPHTAAKRSMHASVLPMLGVPACVLSLLLL